MNKQPQYSYEDIILGMTYSGRLWSGELNNMIRFTQPLSYGQDVTQG